MTMLDYLNRVSVSVPPPVSVTRADIDALWDTMQAAQAAYQDARTKWSPYNPVCLELKKLWREATYQYTKAVRGESSLDFLQRLHALEAALETYQAHLVEAPGFLADFAHVGDRLTADPSPAE